MATYLGDKADFSGIRRVLIIKLQHLGDVLLTTPVFAVLKQRFPRLEIDALVYADTAGMLAGNPHVNAVYCVDKDWRKSFPLKLERELALFNTLRRRRYHLIIALTDRMRAAWLARLLQPRYSVAQRYPHKRGAFWRRSFSHSYSIPPLPRHTVEVHLDALRRLGIYPRGDEKKLVFAPPESARRQTAALLAESAPAARDYVVIHPTSRWMFKSWSISGFAGVARQLAAQSMPVIVVSGPDARERQYADAVCTRSGGVVNLAGRLSLAELAVLIEGARCFIGLDSAAMHIAAAVGTPCVALFGPSADTIWGPWQVPHRIVAADYSCRPCHQDGCGNGKVSDCLQSLSPDDVLAAAAAFMPAAGP